MSSHSSLRAIAHTSNMHFIECIEIHVEPFLLDHMSVIGPYELN